MYVCMYVCMYDFCDTKKEIKVLCIERSAIIIGLKTYVYKSYDFLNGERSYTKKITNK